MKLTDPLVPTSVLLRVTLGTDAAHAEASLMQLEGRPEVLMTDVYVDPVLRGQGYARAVIEALTRRASDCGWTLVTYASPGEDGDLDKRQLLDFYRRCGFAAAIRHRDVGQLLIRYP